MNIASLRLQNFRSYADASWEFGEGVNIVVGPNASGKTNLLDSLVTLFGGSSFRSSDADLVMFNAPWARIDGWGDIGERVFKVELLSEKPSKTYEDRKSVV